MQLPLELRVLRLLRDRAPGVTWDARRVIWCVRDYRDVINVLAVAARLADLVAGGELSRLRDGPATLRSFCEKEKEQRAPNVTPLVSSQASRYDRLVTGLPGSPPPSSRAG